MDEVAENPARALGIFEFSGPLKDLGSVLGV